MHPVLQESDEIFHMRRLACASDGDIADGDDRGVIGVALQDVQLKEQIPETHA